MLRNSVTDTYIAKISIIFKVRKLVFVFPIASPVCQVSI